MTFNESLEILGIEEYRERIYNSSSTGELFFIKQYFDMAEFVGKTDWFPDAFKLIVEYAEKNCD